MLKEVLHEHLPRLEDEPDNDAPTHEGSKEHRVFRLPEILRRKAHAHAEESVVPDHLTRLRQLNEIFAKNTAALSESYARSGHRNDRELKIDPKMPVVYKAMVDLIQTCDDSKSIVPFVISQLDRHGHVEAYDDYMVQRIDLASRQLRKRKGDQKGRTPSDAKDFISLLKNIKNLHKDLSENSHVVKHYHERGDVKALRAKFKESSEELINCGRLLLNNSRLTERLVKIGEVRRHHDKAKGHARNGQFVKALRSLDYAIYCAKKLSSKAGFAKLAFEQSMKLKEKVLADCLKGVQKSIDEFHTLCFRIGYCTLRNVAKQASLEVEPFVFHAGREEEIVRTLGTEFEFILKPNFNVTPLLNFKGLLHFRYVVWFLTDHTELIGIERLWDNRHSYTKLREKFVENIFRIRTERLENVHNIIIYLCNVVGIFATDFVIHQRVPGIVTKEYYERIWEKNAVVIGDTIRDGLASVTEKVKFSVIRDIIHLTLHTFAMIHLDVQPLKDSFKFIYRHQRLDIVASFMRQVEKSLAEDSFGPLVVTGSSEEAALIKSPEVWKHFTEPKSGSAYPYELSFSKSVLDIYDILVEFLAENLNVSLSMKESEDRIAALALESFDHAVNAHLKACFMKMLDERSLYPPQFVQIEKNLTVLCEVLPSSLKNSAARFASLDVTIDCGKTFHNLQEEVKRHLLKELTGYTSVVLQTMQFGSTTLSSNPSQEAVKLVEFLTMFFTVTNVMPEDFQDQAWTTITKYIPLILEDMILFDATTLTTTSMQNLLIDLKFLMKALRFFNKAENASHRVEEAFLELEQVIAFVTNEDWAAYLQTWNKPEAKYPKISPEVALVILDKLEDPEHDSANPKKKLPFPMLSIKAPTALKKKAPGFDEILDHLQQLVEERARGSAFVNSSLSMVNESFLETNEGNSHPQVEDPQYKALAEKLESRHDPLDPFSNARSFFLEIINRKEPTEKEDRKTDG